MPFGKLELDFTPPFRRAPMDELIVESTGLDPDVLLERVERLIAYFLISLEDSPEQFIKYIGGVAEERFVENYSITECLSALRILEEKTWQVIVNNVPQQDLIHALTRVSGNHLSIIRNLSESSQRVPPALPVIFGLLEQ